MNNDQQIWDELLESTEGMDAFTTLMEEAQKEVVAGKTESI